MSSEAQRELKEQLMCTVVSIVPFEIDENKPGLYPGRFQLKAAKEINDKNVNETKAAITHKWLKLVPEVLHIGESVHYIEVDVDRSLPVTDPPYKVAESLVRDYADSQLGIVNEELDTRGPGIFFVQGKVSFAKLMADKQYIPLFEEALKRQTNWFLEMVKIADDDWRETGKHQVINNSQRYAAKFLGMDRPWLITIPDQTKINKCPACRTVVDAEAIVCGNCRCIINKVEYDKLSFANNMTVTAVKGA